MRRILTATLTFLSLPRLRRGNPARTPETHFGFDGSGGPTRRRRKGARLAVGQLSEATEVAEIHAGRQAHPLALALAALGHRLHHLGDHLELLQQRVDL